MKAQTRMIVASAVVIALALTAVSGITYSWFSDTEKADVTVSTAVIDYDVKWNESYTSGINTTATVSDGKIAINNLAAGAAIPVITGITNNSTVKTVYKIYAAVTLAADHNYTLYDLKNIYIGGKQLNASSEDGSTITVGDTLIVDWTPLSVGVNPSAGAYSITTPESYGGDANSPITAYNPKTGEGSALKDDTHTADWTSAKERKGLTITLYVVAVQGDYPYTVMTEDTTGKTVSANMPVNKVVKATSITSSESGSSAVVKDVVVDFSAVGGTEGTTDVSDTKVIVGISKVDETNKQVTVSLALTKSNAPVSNPTFDNPVIMTMTVPGKFTNPEVIYNGDGTDGTVLSSTINSGDTTTITFSVTHFSDYSIVNTNTVTTAEELRKALAVENYVKLGADISVEKSIGLTREVTLDLNGHNIKFTDSAGFVNFDKIEVVGDWSGSAINVLPSADFIFETDKTVTDGTNQYATLIAALEKVTDNATLYCKPGTDVNVGEVNGIVLKNNLTIYGNGAKVTGTLKGFSIDDSKVTNGGLSNDVTLTVYSLDGFSVYCKEKSSDKKITLNLKDCQDLQRVRIDGQKGSVDVTIDGCSFTGNSGSDLAAYETAVKFDPVGDVKITGTKFSNYILAINMKNDGTADDGTYTQNITVIGCTFTNCGTIELTDKQSSHHNHYEDYAASIRVVAANSNSVSNFTTSGNTFSHNGKTLAVADIVFGDSRSVLGPIIGKTNHGTITCYNLDGNEVFGDTAYTTATDKAKDGKITTLTAPGATVKIVLANEDNGKVIINSGGKSAVYEGKTYYITTAEGLTNFAKEVNAGKTFKGDSVYLCADINLYGAGWTPITGIVEGRLDGAVYTGFQGIFDGNEYTVSNFKVNNKECAGFFGQVAGSGEVKNLNIDKATISSNHWTGGIVGHALNALIYNCSVTNTKITVTTELKSGSTTEYDNGDKVGGIAGWCTGTIEKCVVSETTLTAYRDVGGIAGSSGDKTVGNKLVSSLTIKNCIIGKNVKIVQNNENGYKTIDSEFKVDGKKIWGDYCSERAMFTSSGNTGSVSFEQKNVSAN